jgi:hypothetical protein
MTPEGSASAAEVVLHEERVHVDVEREAVRAVVRRRIVTEVRTVEVTVRREVLEVEHEPYDGPALPVAGEPRQALSIVLSEEVPVVSLQVQPYERVSLDVHTVVGEERVTTTSGQERAELTTNFPI